MSKPFKIILFLNLIALLAWFHYSVFSKEELLTNGELILLELAPVDPRSLMQGDYMRLRYAIEDSIDFTGGVRKKGFCILKTDDRGVAELLRLQEQANPRTEGEYPIKYMINGYSLSLGAESWFFQEGQAAKFDSARYGGIRVDEVGNILLVGLFDRQLKQLNE